MASFPSDGSMYGRTFCGVGPNSILAKLGVGGPNVTDEYVLENLLSLYSCPYPNDSISMQKVMDEHLPGWSYLCPENVQSTEDYIQRLQNLTLKYTEIFGSQKEEDLILKNRTMFPFSSTSLGYETIGPAMACYSSNDQIPLVDALEMVEIVTINP